MAEDPHNVGRIVDDCYGVGTGGHTDEFVRFIDDRTVLCAWADEAEKDKNPTSAINFGRMAENFQILAQSTDQDGNPLRIIRVPLPDIFVEEFTPSADNIGYFLGANPELQVGDTIRVVAATSYLNYVISNGIVLLPKYWKPGRDESFRQRDEVVLQLFESVFPDREIVQFDALFLNRAGGGMHCLVQQQPTALN